MIRKLLVTVFSIFFVLLLLYGIGYWNNNKSSSYPARSEIKGSFDKSMSWLVNNREKVMKNHNSALWWMIKSASEINTDSRLGSIYGSYSSKHIILHPDRIWMAFYDEQFRPRVPDITLMSEYSNYQLFLIYGITCDAGLAVEPVIRSQLSPDYCELHFLHPRCVTHQLIGLRLLYERNCLDKLQLDPVISELQNTIVTELTWDFRVGDAYIQRLLMLQESGAGVAIKPVWLHRFLAAQNDDGGWDDIDPVAPLPMGYAFSFTSLLPKITRGEKSDFHATAQAIWLLALLLQEDQPGQL